MTMVVMVILYGLSVLVLWNVLTDEQLTPVLVVMIPMMVFQFANAALLLPDLDHQRFRLALSFAPERLTEEVLKDMSDRSGTSLSDRRGQLRQVDDWHWHEVSQALRERSLVERSVPTLVKVVVGLAAVILGALLGNWFAEVFQPPPVPPGAERFLKVGVIVIVALSMLMIAHSLRTLWTLDQRTIETARRLASQPLADFYPEVALDGPAVQEVSRRCRDDDRLGPYPSAQHEVHRQVTTGRGRTGERLLPRHVQQYLPGASRVRPGTDLWSDLPGLYMNWTAVSSRVSSLSCAGSALAPDGSYRSEQPVEQPAHRSRIDLPQLDGRRQAPPAHR
jgi:hypothetical protein